MKAIKIIGLVFLLIIIIGAEIGYLIYHFQYDMNSLPKGTLITKVDSPNRKYTIKAYVTNGGATTDFAIRGELNFRWEKEAEKCLLELSRAESENTLGKWKYCRY